MKTIVVVLALAAGACAGFEESFSGPAFPPRDWYQASTDVGTARWQWHDTLSRTEPGCGFCAGEKRNLRNADWLITPQCTVVVGDSFGFWLRAKDAAFRESVEVWVSDSSPLVPDFRLLGALATSSASYERYAFDVSSLAGRRVFFAIVYVSAGGKGVLIDDVFGPLSRPSGLTAYFPVDQPRHIRTYHSFIPQVGVRNTSWQGYLVSMYMFFYNKYGVRVYSQSMLDVYVPADTYVIFTFQGFNAGDDTGRWMLACSLAGFHPWNSYLRTWVYNDGFRPYGGPDSAGYTWLDSDDTLGPEYQWFEASASGTRVGGGDDELFEVPLPWPVRFYGQSCSTAYVSTNGWLALGPPAPAGPADSNTAIPCPAEPNRLVAVYWDDLASERSESGIWCQAIGDSLVVLEWHNVGYYGFEACSLNFEALLYGSGIIELQYAFVSAGDTLYDQGLSATVGIENATGTVGLEYVHDGSPAGNLLVPRRAIRFLPREYGIAEGSEQQPLGSSSEPSIVRGVLRIEDRTQDTEHRGELLDATGRRVAVLHPGANDVSGLASGVYFVRRASGVRREAWSVTKVIIQR
jgi:hypothetical protein